MSVHEDHDFDDEHFDEVDAVRRFPKEEEWLDLPTPELADDQGNDSDASFVDRVMRARGEERALDDQLAELDQLLPNEVLQQFAAPDPGDSFVEDTVAAVMNDRRNRWQEMLSRHVAPAPSTAFVSRTLEALKDDRAARRGGTESPAAAAQVPYASTQHRRSNWSAIGLAGAAAAAMLWLLLTDTALPPLEARLANQASPAAAYSEATTPMSAILARVANEEEPYSVFDAPADGLWLVSNKGEVR